jgi:hypothetical protein
LYWDVEVWIFLDLITLILHCLVLWWNRINDYYPTFVFTMCPSVVGFVKCFCKCKCPNHICATSLGLCYGNQCLKGRLNHNMFNKVIITIGFIRCGLWFWPPTLTSLSYGGILQIMRHVHFWSLSPHHCCGTGMTFMKPPRNLVNIWRQLTPLNHGFLFSNFSSRCIGEDL